MTIKDVAKWNARVSIVYALGVWTMVGSYGYYKYMGYYEEKPVKEEEKDKGPENQNEAVYKTAHTKTTVIYKEDFVPYTTRIYNFINSFSGKSGTGDSGK
ncbi:small integral membrane protein 26-like [Polymixia lowei]